MSTSPDARGLFQFAGIPAGKFHLRAGGEGAAEVSPGRRPGGWYLGREPVGKDGTLRIEDAVPGLYRLVVRDPYRNVWHRGDLELIGGHEVFSVDLPLVEVEGIVTRGGEGVRSRLRFQRGRGSSEVSLYSDLEGRFSGAVPGAGSWDLHALFRPQGSWSFVDSVEIEPDEDGTAFPRSRLRTLGSRESWWTPRARP